MMDAVNEERSNVIPLRRKFSVDWSAGSLLHRLTMCDGTGRRVNAWQPYCLTEEEYQQLPSLIERLRVALQPCDDFNQIVTLTNHHALAWELWKCGICCAVVSRVLTDYQADTDFQVGGQLSDLGAIVHRACDLQRVGLILLQRLYQLDALYQEMKGQR